MLSNGGKILDRSPHVRSAGKLFSAGDKARDCLVTPNRPATPDDVGKYRATSQPAPGVQVI